MGTDHDEPPASLDRRRLLLLLGAGAVNVAALRQIDLLPRAVGGGSDDGGRSIVAGREGRTAGDPAGPAAESTVPPQPVPWPTMEPPAVPGAAPAPDAGHVFDLVIGGGRVIDPASGFDAVVDVGIDGDRITALSPAGLVGAHRLDAGGRVVAPGFIDLLSAEPNPFGVWLKLADGVTTNLAMHGVNNYAAAFFDRYEGRTPIHFGGAFHQHFMRGWQIGARVDRALGDRQLDELVDLAVRAMERGLAGVSLSPEYAPGTTTAEMERLARAAAERGHACFIHLRHSDPEPPGTELEALDEALALADATGVSLHVEHLASTGGTHSMDLALDRIEAARARGLDVTACVYPYPYWGTFLASARFADGWRDRYGLTEADLQVAGTETRLTPDTMAEATQLNHLVVAHGTISEAAIEAALARPWMVVASDAIPTAGRNNHPRGAGTFARTLGRYVRRLGVLNMSDGLARMTILPARRTERMIPAMATKGRLQRGADADVVVFDPRVIDDRATVAEPARASVGIDHVVVAGQVALRNGVVDRSVLAGRALRATGGG